MATTLAPVDSREVVRCDRCQLVQFKANNNICRRCKLSLDDDPEPEVVQPEPVAVPMMMHRQGVQVAMAIRTLRLRAGLSQRQLALRMSVPRTYVSKIENEKATPTLSSLERLAKALEVHITELITGGMAGREAELRELTQDPFVSELIPFLGTLNGMQWQSVLSQMRDLTTRPRRTA
ncbi:MAG TPA: helix-turn-helix transcriptional regulator [Terriglobales bacterium]|jgi:transcriptional regulator with XRE-family HTH domain